MEEHIVGMRFWQLGGAVDFAGSTLSWLESKDDHDPRMSAELDGGEVNETANDSNVPVLHVV
jgi:hypothetical protein